jgi:hypothetical protein
VVDGARTRVDVVVQHPLLSIVGTLRPQTGTLHPWLRGPSGCATALAWVGTPAALCWLRQHGDGHSSPQGSDRFFSTSSGKERRTTRWAIPVCTLRCNAGQTEAAECCCISASRPMAALSPQADRPHHWMLLHSGIRASYTFRGVHGSLSQTSPAF